MYRNSTLAVVITCTIASAAHAARLTEVDGNVLVNKGEGFLEVNGATAVSAGDRILVRGKGTAKIDYGDGCVKKISANQTAVVTSKPVCDPAPVVAQKQPVPKLAGSLKEAPATPGVIESVPDHHIATIGGIVAVATGALLIASQGGDGNKGTKGGSSQKDEVSASFDVTSLVDDAASTAAAVPLDSESAGKRIAVVDDMVVAKTEAAAVALDGGDKTDGSPASP